MATWFVVVGRILQVEGIPDRVYKNALCEFEEGEHNSRDNEIRTFYVAFYKDLYKIAGATSCLEIPVCQLHVCFTGHGALC